MSASRSIATNWARKRRLLFAEILMFAISKLILLALKVMKGLLVSQTRKETALQNSWQVDGSIPIVNFTRMRSSTHGGACEREEEQKESVGDLTISSSMRSPYLLSRIHWLTTIYMEVTTVPFSWKSSWNDSSAYYLSIQITRTHI